MRFSILGPLEVRDDDGHAVAFTRRLHKSALTLLLLNAGQPCSSAKLVRAIWGDEPPLSPDVSLRTCVYGIRKLLPDPGRLRTHPSGYLIITGPGEVDVDDFRDLAGRGRDALDVGKPREAAALLGRALGQWREPPLDDVPAVPARERLLGMRQEARDALVDAKLALGEHRQVLSELRATVTADPLREHAWAQLIIALYRSGARAEALAAFGRLRMALVSAYGIDPGPELQDLHRRVLADDPSLTLPAEPRLPEVRVPQPRATDAGAAGAGASGARATEAGASGARATEAGATDAAGRPTRGRPARGRPARGRPARGRPTGGRLTLGRAAPGRPTRGRRKRGRPSEVPPGAGRPAIRLPPTVRTTGVRRASFLPRYRTSPAAPPNSSGCAPGCPATEWL